MGGILAKLGKIIRKIRKKIRSLGKFVMKIWKKIGLLGKLTCNIRKVGGETKKKKKSSLNFGWKIRKVEPSWESSSGILGKLGKFIWKIRKIRKKIGLLGKLGKFSCNWES